VRCQIRAARWPRRSRDPGNAAQPLSAPAWGRTLPRI